MKKLVALLLALILLMTAAAAQGSSTPDLYDIYDRTGGGLKWTGNAVPFMEGVAFASPSVVPDDSTELAIWDGKAYRDVYLGLLTAGGTLLVVGGEALSVSRLSVESGDVAIAGRIGSLIYEEAPAGRGGFWGRMFRG